MLRSKALSFRKQMKLILLSSPKFFIEEDKIISTLFDEGLDILHLSKPGTEPVYSERLLTLLGEKYNRHIIACNHFYLKDEFSLMGIALNRDNPTIPADYNGTVVRNCYSLEELAPAKKNSQYVILKDTLDSISSPERHSPYTIDQLHQASRQGLIDRHVMAQTGVSLETIPQLHDLGFGGVVVCSDLWKRFSIHNGMDYKELINHFHRLCKAVE